MVILQAFAIKKQVSFKSRNPKAHHLQVVYTQEDSICDQSSDLTYSNESFCLQMQIQSTQASAMFPTSHHLITNHEYRLEPHYKRNWYLRARLDTCADVNLKLSSV